MSGGLGETQAPDPFGEASVRVAQLLAMTITLIEAVALIRARQAERPAPAPQPEPALRVQVNTVAPPRHLTGRPLIPALDHRPARPVLAPVPQRRQLTAGPSRSGGVS